MSRGSPGSWSSSGSPLVLIDLLAAHRRWVERRSAAPTAALHDSLTGNLISETSVVCPRVTVRSTPAAFRRHCHRGGHSGPAARSRSDRVHDANGQKYKAAEVSCSPLWGIRAPARCLLPQTLEPIARGTAAGDLGSDRRRRSSSLGPARPCCTRHSNRR